MNLVDLHVHSTASDGTLTPSEVICLAKKNHISALALTDHDTVDGIDEALMTGKRLQVEVIPGIELSCSYMQKEIHMVGLFIDHKDTTFQEELNQMRRTRKLRNEEMVKRFQEHHIAISLSALRERFGNAVITRAHFARYLYEQGMVSSVREAFDRYLNDHGPCFVPRDKMPCEKTIQLIHDAGGIAILAHPVLYKMSSTALSDMVSHLKKHGLDGIEAIYSTYTPADEVQIRKLARENNLLISGGSDFHGTNKPHIALGNGKGNLKVPFDVLTNLRRYHSG